MDSHDSPSKLTAHSTNQVTKLSIYQKQNTTHQIANGKTKTAEFGGGQQPQLETKPAEMRGHSTTTGLNSAANKQ